MQQILCKEYFDAFEKKKRKKGNLQLDEYFFDCEKKCFVANKILRKKINFYVFMSSAINVGL